MSLRSIRTAACAALAAPLALVLLSGTTATAAPAPASVPPIPAGDRHTVAVAVADVGRPYVYWRGTDGRLVEAWEVGGHWYGPTVLNSGVMASEPTVAINTAGTQYVSWRGGDGNAWQLVYDHGWSGPHRIPVGAVAHPPTAYPTPRSGPQSLYWRDARHYLALTVDYATGWSTPTEDINAGTLGSDPAVTQDGGAVLQYWRGTDNRAWLDGPSGVHRLPVGTIGSAPAAASDFSDQSVYWRGTDGNLWTTVSSDATTWSAPLPLGMGPLGSQPAAGADEHNSQYVFWIGGDRNLWEATNATGHWNGPIRIGMGPLG